MICPKCGKSHGDKNDTTEMPCYECLYWDDIEREMLREMDED